MINRTKTWEYGAEVVSRTTWFLFDSLDEHKATETHTLLLELKSNDPESHSLALNTKNGTSKMRMWCGGV